MFDNKSDKPTGYDYPPPSIGRGQTRAPHAGAPLTLSKENVDKIRQAVREQGVQSKAEKA